MCLQIFFILGILVNSVIFCTKTDSVFSGAEKVQCNNRTQEKVNNLIPYLAPVGTDIRIPENELDLRKYCNLFNKNLPFILGMFRYCSSQFAQTLAKFLFFPLRKQMDNICKIGKISRPAREFISAGKCGNKAREPLKECNDNLIDALNGIPKAPVKSRIYMTCCHSNAYRICLRDVTEDTVGCTRHTIDWAEKFVLRMIGGTMELVCGEYFEESDKCTKLMAETPKPEYPKSYMRPKSFIKPMIDLLESFPEIEIKQIK